MFFESKSWRRESIGRSKGEERMDSRSETDGRNSGELKEMRLYENKSRNEEKSSRIRGREGPRGGVDL
jgi:hypothetical protein